ncbi:GNAT family N-acetyltransferase [Streptomyces paromomycinus]|uniref:Putative succinyl-CoA transferase n=1 Tax=Streptomyces paromomycinus TaxID=92743 RepID=A0A401W3L7_STREY|nr:GNAT family protein [Streptomyces paromomycinus]GCD43923.1 putative succinyl-CoA transferase [Streptomyces paromomycinus]
MEQQLRRHHWPLYGIRIRTPRLELSLPGLGLLDDLASVAADGVHDAADMPFTVPWTDVTPEERGRATFLHVLRTVAEWRPESWTLSLAVTRDGKAVGRQDVVGTDFGVTREAETGSWLGLAHQGQGIGTEMRAAVLHFVFDRLGADTVTSAAMTDNARSLAVSRKLGYVPDGVQVAAVRGQARTLQRLRLDRAGWEAHRTVPVEVVGWTEECRALFGA